jgi:predicted methyltransferase
MRRAPTFILPMILLLALAIGGATALSAGLEEAPGVMHSSALPESAIPQPIKDAVNASARSAADRKLDASRRPEQWMALYGIKPGMKVADLSAGGGYTTELLARIVGPEGKVYSQNGPAFLNRFPKAGDAWHKRLEAPALKNVTAIVEAFDSPKVLPADGALDAVIINLNYHDLVLIKVKRDDMNHAVWKALKPGGVYGIVDNSAAPGSGARDVGTLHRIDEDFVIREVEHAGFKLVAASDALRNPSDPRTEHFRALHGKQDRFILKFVKPS